MTGDLTKFIDSWVYDIQRILTRRRDSLAEDLVSEDERTRTQAEKEIDQIHEWLYSPLPTAKRGKGRPRDESSQHAIRSLTLHLATPSSWREIALIVRGCNHKRPRPTERSCKACGEAIRQSAFRLQTFLKSKGLMPDIPRRAELDRMTRAELERLWSTAQ